MTEAGRVETPSKGPRPIAAFFVSLICSTLVLGLLVLSDGRVLELKKARADAQELDRQIALLREQNQSLRGGIEAARRHEFPAERVAREELHLVHPEDIVLLYPEGTLSPRKPRPGVSPVDKPKLSGQESSNK